MSADLLDQEAFQRMCALACATYTAGEGVDYQRTLSIAVDNTNVTELPVGNLRDVAGMARRFAKQAEDGEYGAISRMICIVECEGGMPVLIWGDEANHYELMGIFEAAKLRIFADQLIDDDE